MYAYAMIVYYIQTGRKPMETLRAYGIESYVCNGSRLDVNSVLEADIGGMIFNCWDQAPDSRMSFDEIVSFFYK